MDFSSLPVVQGSMLWSCQSEAGKLDPAPPPTNRGALSASQEKSGLILDWLAFTVPYCDGSFKAISDLIGFFSEREYGLQGYSHSAVVLSSGFICWSPERPEQGIHVILPSSALALLSTDSLSLPFAFEIFGKVNITRADFAIDDFSGGGYLDLDIIFQHLRAGDCVTRYRWAQKQDSGFAVGGDYHPGQTIYVGSSASDSRIRFYDKKAEQESKHISCQYDSWIRFEIQLRRERAHAVLSELTVRRAVFQDAFNWFGGFVLGLLDFKERSDSDATKSRWASCSWWVGFLQSVDKNRLSLPKIASDLGKVMDWWESSIATISAVIMQADPVNFGGYFDNGLEWLVSKMSDASLKFGPRHRALLENSAIPF